MREDKSWIPWKGISQIVVVLHASPPEVVFTIDYHILLYCFLNTEVSYQKYV